MIRDLPANRERLEALALVLSDMDRKEIALSSGRGPREALLSGLEHSRLCRVIIDDEGPLAAWGFVGVGEVGSPWLLSAEQHRFSMKATRKLMRGCRRDIEKALTWWPRLTNKAWSGNRPHLRLLEKLGFEFAEDPRSGEPRFVIFGMEREYV